MKEDINHLKTNLQQALEKIRLHFLANHTGESAYSECLLQEGYNNYLRIQFQSGKINFFIDDFSWADSPNYSIPALEWTGLSSDMLQQEVIPAIREVILEEFSNPQHQPMYRYYLQVFLEFNLHDLSIKENFVLEDADRQSELRTKMEAYIDRVIYNMEQKFKDDREEVVFAEHLLDFQLMQYGPSRAIEIMEQIFQHTLQDIRNQKRRASLQHSLLYAMKSRLKKDFIPLYFHVDPADFLQTEVPNPDIHPDQVDPEWVALYVYDAYQRIKAKDYAKQALQNLELADQVFGSVQAKQFLQLGTGKISPELMHLKDSNLEIRANDVTALIDIKIKSESAETYAQALDFIIRLLQHGFPVAYSIKLSSKAAKEFLPIKGLAQSATHRFFANCLNYPEVYPKLQEYAQHAMQEFEWYNDIEEGEKSLLPGSYAVFGLGLRDSRYFPLVHQYFDLLDDEHQMAHRFFLSKLIDSYDLNAESLALILAGILSAQFEMHFKNLETKLLDEEKLQLFLHAIQDLPAYDCEVLFMSIWGRNYEKNIKKLKSSLKNKLLSKIA